MMMNKLRIYAALCSALCLSFFWSFVVRAQVQDDRWSEPLRLSSEDGTVVGSGAVMTTDQYGYVHAVWGEDGFSDDRVIVQYAYFDGENWSTPVDIFVSSPLSTFGFISPPVVDREGTIHVVWTMGESGPVYYMYAPAHDAASAQNWTRVPPITLPSNRAQLQIDSMGVLHLVYSNLKGAEPGVYYIRSEDKGETWSRSYWIDPDIPLNYTPVRVDMKIDETDDSLHILWKYDETIDDEAIGKEIRYSHSLDGGRTWSLPFIIDEANEEVDELRAGGMVFTAYSKQVHVVWAGTSTTHREHRFSLDGGTTWSETRRVFGELNGSAGDSLTIDGAGRFQFLGQIRFPQGLYNISWTGDRWSDPSLVYLIRRTSEEEHQGIHIHSVEAVVRMGNQLVITFTNSPAESQVILYTMHRLLEDVPSEPIVPTPAPTLTPTPIPTPTPIAPTAEPTRSFPQTIGSDGGSTLLQAPTPANVLWLSLIPVLVLVAVVVTFGLVRKQ